MVKSGIVNLYVDGRKVSTYAYEHPKQRERYIEYWESVYEDHSRLSIGIVPDMPKEKKPLVRIPDFVTKGAIWNPTQAKRLRLVDAPTPKRSSQYT